MSKDPAINLNEWYTPNTYGSNYMSLPEMPGVYLLVLREFDFYLSSMTPTILYVGSSDNLYQRCKNHPVKTKILESVKGNHTPDVACFFRICDDYRVVEKKLIKQTQARYNKQWR